MRAERDVFVAEPPLAVFDELLSPESPLALALVGVAFALSLLVVKSSVGPENALHEGEAGMATSEPGVFCEPPAQKPRHGRWRGMLKPQR